MDYRANGTAKKCMDRMGSGSTCKQLKDHGSQANHTQSGYNSWYCSFFSQYLDGGGTPTPCSKCRQQ